MSDWMGEVAEDFDHKLGVVLTKDMADIIRQHAPQWRDRPTCAGWWLAVWKEQPTSRPWTERLGEEDLEFINKKYWWFGPIPPPKEQK